VGFPPVATYAVRCVPTSTASPSCTSTGAGVVDATVPAFTSPLQAVLDGAVQGAAYRCYAAAHNDVLSSDVCSTASAAVTVTGHLPSAPAMGVPTSSGVGLLDVPFTASSDPGVPPVVNYVVKCLDASVASPSCASSGAGVHAVSVSPSGGPALRASFAGLAGGAYTCYAIADNGQGGTACSSASASTVVTSPPSAPTIQSAAAVAPSGTLVVTFDASADAGVPAVSNYTVRCVASSTPPACSSAGPSVVVAAGGAAPLNGTLTGLTGGDTYYCFAIANNGVGGDACSSASNAVTIPTVLPSAPVITSTTSPGVGLLTVSFTGSTTLGNPPVARYVVRCIRLRSGGVVLPSCLQTGTDVYDQTVAVGASPLQAALTSLPGDSYACYAIADNGVGGLACSTVSAVTGVDGPPTAPVIGTAQGRSDGTITVSFTASTR
jgi:hypothetical protein